MLLNKMASRTYYLQIHTGTGVTPLSGWVSDESPLPIDNHSEQEVIPPYEDSGPHNEVTSAVWLYSNVAASRSPSRSGDRPVLPSGGLVAGPEVLNVPIESNNENIAYSGESEARDSNEGVKMPDKLEWTTVQRRCADRNSFK